MSKKVRLEWQVNLLHSGYHLNGRGDTPEAAMADLVTRANAQLATATEERDRFKTKIENLEAYLEDLSGSQATEE